MLVPQGSRQAPVGSSWSHRTRCSPERPVPIVFPSILPPNSSDITTNAWLPCVRERAPRSQGAITREKQEAWKNRRQIVWASYGILVFIGHLRSAIPIGSSRNEKQISRTHSPITKPNLVESNRFASSWEDSSWNLDCWLALVQLLKWSSFKSELVLFMSIDRSRDTRCLLILSTV